MTIVNLAPHALTVLREEDGGDHTVTVGRGPSARTTTVTVVATVPPSGTVAGAREESSDSDPVIVDGVEVPVQERRFAEPTNLPDPEEGVLLFVSALTLSAAAAAGRGVSDLLTPGLQASKEGKPFGILSFARQG